MACNLCDLKKNAREIISQYNELNQPLAFWLFNTQALEDAVARWHAAMPSVRPCYAIKCNPLPEIVKVLGDMGCGWDCATINEIKEVIKLGFDVKDVVFSQTFKPFDELVEAYELGVPHATVDSISEVEKMAKYAPNMGVIVRVSADDKTAEHSLGEKFGLHEEEIEPVIAKIKELGLKMTGTHFHVGTGAHSPEAFREAMTISRNTFALGEKYGFAPRIVDIGGGFSQIPEFEMFGTVIEQAIKDLKFPEGTIFKAEPGRYMAVNCLNLCCSIHGKRNRVKDGEEVREYITGDGIHGSLAFVATFHKELPCVAVTKCCKEEKFPSIIYGPTCNGSDKTFHGDFPEMTPGQDWIMYPNVGAYTMSLATNFNGYQMKNHKMYILPGTQFKTIELPEDIQKYGIPALSGQPLNWSL